MSIDYKGEVDSGFDRKRIVERAIISCLKEGIPLDIIKQCKYYNFRHNEMLRNLERNYGEKSKEIAKLYNIEDIESVVVPDNFSKVSHPVGGELYPMTDQEEIKSFSKLNKIKEMINKHKVTVLDNRIKECQKMLDKYIKNDPIIITILNFVNQVEIEEKNLGYNVTFERMQEIALNLGLDIEKFLEYNLKYEEYKKLYEQISIAQQNFNEIPAEEKKELYLLKCTKKGLEEEIIKRNIKLVNWFIRDKYGNLIVESDDLFQVCYLGLALAVRGFDYKKGFKFSTYAHKCMDVEVKRNFKALTGQPWDLYWVRKNIIHLLRFFKEELGHDVTIEYLDKQGLLPVPIEKAENLLKCKYSLPYTSDLPDAVPLEEVIDEDSKQIEEIVDKSLLIDNIKEVLSTLPERDARVLFLRFGLDGKTYSLDEISKDVGLSRDYIHAFEANALRKLRHPDRSKYIKGLL